MVETIDYNREVETYISRETEFYKESLNWAESKGYEVDYRTVFSFRPYDEFEYENFRNNIEKNGQKSAIPIYKFPDGTLVFAEGRTRAKAMLSLNREPLVRIVEVKDRSEMVSDIISLQIQRRQDDNIRTAMSVLEMVCAKNGYNLENTDQADDLVYCAMEEYKANEGNYRILLKIFKAYINPKHIHHDIAREIWILAKKFRTNWRDYKTIKKSFNQRIKGLDWGEILETQRGNDGNPTKGYKPFYIALIQALYDRIGEPITEDFIKKYIKPNIKIKIKK